MTGETTVATPPAVRVAVFVVAAVVAVALGGLVGLAVVVAVAALRLSGAPGALLGGTGVVLLVAAPFAVLANGLPDESRVSPAFVSETLVPHHLVFAGLGLLSAWVVLDLAPRRVRRPHPEPTGPADEPGGPLWLRRVLFALVVAAALAASVAVLGA